MNIIFKRFMFDFLYEMADQLIKKHNPCQIYKDASGKAHCIAGLPCCDSCRFLGPDGCTTKCLGCKLGLCSIAREANPGLDKILTRMRNISWTYGLKEIRRSKKETFDKIKQKKLIHLQKWLIS